VIYAFCIYRFKRILLPIVNANRMLGDDGGWVRFVIGSSRIHVCLKTIFPSLDFRPRTTQSIALARSFRFGPVIGQAPTCFIVIIIIRHAGNSTGRLQVLVKAHQPQGCTALLSVALRRSLEGWCVFLPFQIPYGWTAINPRASNCRTVMSVDTKLIIVIISKDATGILHDCFLHPLPTIS
jgi:hypothetical protein